MSNIEILPMSPSHPSFDDAVRLFDQYRQFYEQPTDVAQCRQFLVDRLSRGESTLLLATAQKQAAAMAQLYSGFSSIQCSHTVILNDLFVHPNFRSLGVGRVLVEAAIGLAKASGATSIQLETAQDNDAAQKLYQRLGFARSTGFVPYTLSLSDADREQSA